MIKILQHYIARTVIIATLLAAVVIASVLFLLAIVGQLKSIGQGDYGLIQALLYVLMQLPNDLYQFAPMLILLGSIMGLSMLSNHKELAVMRASGFSITQIIISVFIGAILLIIVMTGLGEGFGPALSSKAEIQKQNAENAGQAVVTASGIWLHLENNFIHVNQVVDHQRLEGVTRYEFDDKHRLQVAYYAKSLTAKDNVWTMNDVVKTSFYNDRTHSQTLEQVPWNLKFNSNLLNVSIADPSQMPLPKLKKFSKYLVKNGLQATPYQYDFWRRVMQPFASLVMIFLAIPFVLGTFRSALSLRIVLGILVGFAFFIFNEMLGQICVVYQVPTFLAASLPPLLFVLIGVLLSKRMLRY